MVKMGGCGLVKMVPVRLRYICPQMSMTTNNKKTEVRQRDCVVSTAALCTLNTVSMCFLFLVLHVPPLQIGFCRGLVL